MALHIDPPSRTVVMPDGNICLMAYLRQIGWVSLAFPPLKAEGIAGRIQEEAAKRAPAGDRH